MTRAEILSEIKLAEEEAKRLVTRAHADKNQKINEAKSDAREILKSAEEESVQYYISEINKSRNEFQKEKEKIIKQGYLEAEEIKSNAQQNISKATEFILTEFERAGNA